jgi:hypothetical protein
MVAVKVTAWPETADAAEAASCADVGLSGIGGFGVPVFTVWVRAGDVLPVKFLSPP